MINRLLITGCTHGLGRALSCEFSQTECIVYAVGRNEALLNNLAQTSSQIRPILADITTEKGRAIIYEQIDKDEPFSIIHNAAMLKPSQFDSLNEASFREQIETNFISPLLITQQLLPFLHAKQRVLNITSGAANLVLPGLMPYCTSKAAMQLAMRCLSAEFESKEIFFANLNPGMMNTPMQETLRTAGESALPGCEFYRNALKEGKLIPVELVAKFVAWVLLKTEGGVFSEKTWNIYDKSHYMHWLEPDNEGLLS